MIINRLIIHLSYWFLCLLFLQEKQNIIPDELGKDAKSVSALQRRHANFEHDLVTIGTQVSCLNDEAPFFVLGCGF